MGCVGSVCGRDRKKSGRKTREKNDREHLIGSTVKVLGGPSL